MLSAIFFDLGNTLLDFTWAEATALSCALTELVLPRRREIRPDWEIRHLEELPRPDGGRIRGPRKIEN